MKLKLVATTIVVETERGRFSTRVDFSDGVNVVSAHNSTGKTTVLMSILYALGMEGMLGPGIVMPLKSAAYEVIADTDGSEHAVLSSYVMLEIENADGERLTAQRWLKHDRYRRDLVRSWAVGKLSDPEAPAEPRDRYTRTPGSATHEAGWHTHLARFLGWDLPEVARYDGSTTQLYMQIFFPLLFVEQTRGWASILGIVPRHLRVRDPGRRAVEFLLDLDANERARQREQLRAREAELLAEWRAAVAELQARLDSVGGRVHGLPRAATVEWPPAAPAQIEVIHGETFFALPEAMRALRSELQELTGPAPRVGEAAGETDERLRDSEERLARLSAVTVQTAGELRAQQADLEALLERQAALDGDRERYADALKLRDLGSVAPLAQEGSRCPTCEQRLPHTLHGADLGTPVLTLEANLELIDQERATVRAMRADAVVVLASTRERALALRQGLNDARAEVRTLKSALVQTNQAPSEAFIARRIRHQDRLQQLESLEDLRDEIEERLARLAEELRQVRGSLQRIGVGGQSDDDRAKLDALARSVREQLDEYGFASFLDVEIDPDSYLPEREGIDLNQAASASDTVRLVWAYTVGLLEVAREAETNHPGLLVMDEPGQHEMELESLRALFARLSRARQAGQQVVVATSMPFDEVDRLASELDVVVARFQDRVLTHAI